MIKELLFIALALFAGIFAYMHTHGISMITQFTNIPNTLIGLWHSATTYLTNNPLASLIGGGGITIIGILARQFQNMKAKAANAIQQAQAWKSETFQINAVTDKLLKEKKDLETKVTTLQEQVNTIPQQVTDLTTKIADLEKENQELRTESELWKKVKAQAT